MIKVQSTVGEIGEKLCYEFQKIVPLRPQKTKPGKKVSEDEIKASSEAAMKRFYELARKEIHSHRLGLIGRARVALDLQQRLLTKGYSPSLVKQVLFSMLASVFVGRN